LEEKSYATSNIPKFKPVFNVITHVHQCENEWKIIGYRDERVCPHMFPRKLDGIPYKWYKIEEAWAKTFSWIKLKENFIKDFDFRPEEAQLIHLS
jgi:hypothetical protein